MEVTGTIQLNGSPHPWQQPDSLAALLTSLGFSGKPVVLELNECAVFPRDYAITEVRPGDRVEIVALAAGG